MAQINELVDFINLMTYDFRGAWDANGTIADHHAPLKRRTWDTNNLNVEGGVNYWLSKGMNASKINVGIPAYGRTWKLASNVTTPPAAATGPADGGSVTGEPGIMSYFEICQEVRNNSWPGVSDVNSGTYVHSNTSPIVWAGFDDVNSAIEKSRYIVNNKLGGAMIWDLSMDDFRNVCAGGVFPLTAAIHNIVVPV